MHNRDILLKAIIHAKILHHSQIPCNAKEATEQNETYLNILHEYKWPKTTQGPSEDCC